MSEPETAAVVIGVGNAFRRDDGVGLHVLGLLRGAVPGWVRLAASDGEPGGLIEEWAGAALAVVIDALRLGPGPGGSTPGRTHRFVAGETAPGPGATVSSHGLGVGDAIGLATALDLMPARLVVHAVEVADCGYGAGLTPAVQRAAVTLAAAVLRDLGVPGAGLGPGARTPS